MNTKVLFLFWFLPTCLNSVAGTSDLESEIKLVSSSPTPENVIELSGRLRWIGENISPPESHANFRRIQSTLLAIPGHARFFAEKLETMRCQDRTKGRVKYGRYLYLYAAGTLAHLPSPETVGVLGKMLEDTRDAPPPDDPARDLQSGNFTMNPHLAAVALSKMKFRDHPLGHEFFPVLHNINPWLEWWKEVKAGERTFSFEGQNVEYRFKPDGTWDTIPLAGITDKGSSATVNPYSKVREKKVKHVPPQPEVPPDSGWAWIIGATMLVLATVLWLSLKSLQSNRG